MSGVWEVIEPYIRLSMADRYAALEELLSLAMRDGRSVVVWERKWEGIIDAQVTPYETPTAQLYVIDDAVADTMGEAFMLAHRWSCP